jgi:FkbM family methyltransferase
MPFPLSEALGLSLPTLHVVDVGASMVEGEDHYAPLVRRGLCTVTGFEPDPAQLAALEASGRPGYRYLPYALGDGGAATFHVARFPGCSSLLPPNTPFLDRFTAIGGSLPDGNFATTHTVPVDTRRLDEVEELGPVDYLKLDIQGVEGHVLRHAERVLSTVSVLESEVLFAPLYEGQVSFGALAMLLEAQGFVLWEIRDVHRCAIAPFLPERTPFPSRGMWMWADAVFVRPWWDLTPWTEVELLKAATILHEVYEAYDLVHHLLLEHQIRTDHPSADRYRAAMARIPELARDWPLIRSAWGKAVSPERVQRARAAHAREQDGRNVTGVEATPAPDPA